MKKVIIIGTIHLNWTPKDELEEVLRDINPDKVLVELDKDELYDNPREDSVRDEMFVVYDWAVRNKKKVDYFDTGDSSLKDGVTGKEPEFLQFELECKKLLKNHSWKDLNKEGLWNIPSVKKLKDEIKEKYFDKEKSKKREYEMLSNIKNKLINGVNVIVTGAGHLSFFEKEMPDAVLPLRN